MSTIKLRTVNFPPRDTRKKKKKKHRDKEIVLHNTAFDDFFKIANKYNVYR